MKKSRSDLDMFNLWYRLLNEKPSFRRPRRRSRQFRLWYRARLFAISTSITIRRSSSLPSSSFSCIRSASCLFLAGPLPLLCPRIPSGDITSRVCSLMKVRIKPVEIMCVCVCVCIYIYIYMKRYIITRILEIVNFYIDIETCICCKKPSIYNL